jgi:tRNA uridine 5-carboxymethylaminomethyl modification enzyme
VNYSSLLTLCTIDGESLGLGIEDADEAYQVETQIKYEGYINRQREDIERQQQHEQQRIPDDLDYDEINSLSFEVRQKLKAAQPASIGDAIRVSGVTPAAITTLLIHLKRQSGRNKPKKVA